MNDKSTGLLDPKGPGSWFAKQMNRVSELRFDCAVHHPTGAANAILVSAMRALAVIVGEAENPTPADAVQDLPDFDITKPVTPDQDAALAVDVLTNFALRQAPFSPGDGKRVAEVIQALRRRLIPVPTSPAMASLNELDRPHIARLQELQHSGTPLAKPKLGGSILGWAADEIAALRAAPASALVRDAFFGLEWTEDGYSLRTPFDGDVDGDGRPIITGGETVATFADSDDGDEVRLIVANALAGAPAAPSSELVDVSTAAAAGGETLFFVYRNWRGEVAMRQVSIPIVTYYGATEWHPEKQWLIRAHDVDRGDVRVFALRDIRFLHQLYTDA